MSFTDDFLNGLAKRNVITLNNTGGNTPSVSSKSQKNEYDSFTKDYLSGLEKYKTQGTGRVQLPSRQNERSSASQGLDSWKSKYLPVFGVNEGYIRSFIQDSSALLNDYVSGNYQGSADTYKGLRLQGSIIEDYLKENQNGLSGTITSTLRSRLAALDQMGQDYSWYDKYRGQGYEEISALLSNMEDSEEKDWLMANQNEIFRSSSDYSERAKAGMAAFDAAQKQKAADKEDETWIQAVGKYLGSISDTTMPLGDTGRMINEMRADTSDQEPRDSWTEDQRNMYGYLYSVDPSVAADYAIGVTESRRQSENEAKKTAIAQWVTKNKVNATAGTVAAIAMMPLSLADTLYALTEYNAKGRVAIQAAPMPGQMVDTITGAIGQELNEKYGTLNEKIPVIGGRGWGDAYQLGTSIANSLLSAYTQGTVGTDVVFFGSAASSTMYNAKNRGATDEQAIKLGLLAGLSEAAGEHFSVENLIHMNDSGTLRAFFGNVLKQSGIEASEEGFTTLMNNLAEQLVMKENSSFYELVREFKGQGLSEEEAKKKAWISMANDLAFDMVGGFVSGGVSTGVQTGAQKAFSWAAGSQQGQNQTHHIPAEGDGQAAQAGGKDFLTTEGAEAENNPEAEKEGTAAGEKTATVSKNETVEEPITLEGLSRKYGNQAKDMERTYMAGQDIEEFDQAFQMAYEMGRSGVSKNYVDKSAVSENFNATQRDIAYNLGTMAAAETAKSQAFVNSGAANGQTGWRQGTVRGQDVKIADMAKAFNDPQKKAFKYLSNIAQVTGVDIVLYKSQVGTDGKYLGNTEGSFKWDENTIYIDINAGLSAYQDAETLAKYTMMRTFDHEFTHFIEKWNPEAYNEFRQTVLAVMEQNGENVDDLISTLQAKSGGSLSYEQASREVIAEAMTDILPETSFIETLAQKNQNVFQQLLSKLKEFVSSLKAHFAAMGTDTKEARILKKQTGDTVAYMEEIVRKFDEIAVGAVENYQKTVAEVVADSMAKENKAKTERKADPPKKKAIKKKMTPNQEEMASQNEKVSRSDTESKGPKETIKQVATLDLTYNFIAPRFSFLENSGNGRYVLYDDLTLDLRDKDGINEMRGWKDGGLFHLFDILVDGKRYSENSTDFPNGYYEITETVSRAKVESSALSTFVMAEKGVLRARNPDAAVLDDSDSSTAETATDSQKETFSEKDKPAQKGGRKGISENGSVKSSDKGNTPGFVHSQGEKNNTSSEKLAEKIGEYLDQKKPLTAKDLYAMADEAFGGTQAEGAYNRKDAYDAMELAVNKYLLTVAREFNGDQKTAVDAVKYMQNLLELLPTQSVRTQEQQDFQQFSTPPNIAYLAAWAANISAQDSVLEPSAGIGGLAVFAKAWGAEVTVNELSNRRLEVLRAMSFDHLYNENAEQIDNILPDTVSPSVVIMNPPFSSTAGRTKGNKTSNAEKHIDQALQRLQDGGRLVAILGKGMNNADYSQYWDKLRESYHIRANISIDGSNYKKYGTTWGVQLVVIDKIGPQAGETVTGEYTDLTEVPMILEGIRNDRSNVEKSGAAGSADRVSQPLADGGNAGNSDAGHSGSGERTDGSAANLQRKKNRKVAGGTEKSAGRTHGETAAKAGSKAAGSEERGADRTDGRTDSGNGADADGYGASDHNESQLQEQGLTDQDTVSDDGVYATFVAPEIPVKGSRKHPAVLVESAAMAAVSMPKATYVPKLPENVLENNLSDAQMVTVTYAGQAHEQKLPDGRRKGFFIGDGTGVGKGRQIAGIILDNFMQGRDKAVWISKNDDLYADAVRDWTQTTGRSKEEVVSQGKFKPSEKITLKNGVLFTSYGKLKMEKGGNRLEQIVQWVGKDFDGVIAFDEAHFMGNLFGKKGKFGKTKGSLTAKAGVELQRQLPNARIVYVSATAATEVDNLAYAERLGLWGQGTAFNDAQEFITKIGSSGLAAMELVIRDMKAMGTYVARSISYNGVNYETVEHTLDPMQREIYDTMSRAWQKTMSGVQSALVTTGGRFNSTERQRAMGNFYSSMQRFYNQVLTSMAMPSVIADMRKELAAGHSCVMQIVNTNEAQQNKQLAEAKASGDSLDNLDMTPREALIGYLNTSFPTQMFEEYTDEDGNLRSRPVLDSSGTPVQSKEAIRQRDSLIAEVNQMSIPDGPLEMLFDAFGPEAVAENTGRSRRVVPKKQEDGSITRVEERRSLNHRTADVQAFQDGKKRILVFSDAGGTGKSYHADRAEKNQQLRVHYVLQPGWVASNAVQGFGRTHRSNEVSAPVYKLVTTNIKGQKRFTSTIARRLDQLGALTKGQRDTGSGMFGAKDNLETDLARDSLREFYKRLGKNQIQGINGMKTLDRLGLKQKFTDEYGGFKMNDVVARDMSTFLNRILSLEVEEQNTVFDAFISIYEMELEAAIQAGTLDTGMENVKADKIEVVDDKVIRQDKNSGAATHYIQAKTYTKPKVISTVVEMSRHRTGFEGLYMTDKGAVRAVFRMADKTTEWGAIQKQYRLVGPNLGARTNVWTEQTLNSRAKAIDKADWQKQWDEEVKKVPEYNEDTIHMLTGALLPIWNTLPQETNAKVKRLIANDGSIYLGRVISKDTIDSVLRSFSIARTMEVFTAQQIMDKALKEGMRFQLTNDRTQIYRSRVSNEWRLEISQPYNTWQLMRRYPGLIQERINFRERIFVPVGENGLPILDKLLRDNPVRAAIEDREEFRQRTTALTDREVLAIAANELSMDGMSEAERSALTIFRDRLSKLDDLQEKRAELGRQYKQQQFGEKVDREAAAETLDKMHTMDARIQEASAKVLDVEEKKVLRDVLKKARKVVEKKQKEHDDEILKRWRDHRNNAAAIRKYQKRIQKDVNTITEWALKPSGKDILKHIPDALKETVIPFITSIDFTSKRQLNGGKATQADKVFVDRLESLRKILAPNVDARQMYSKYDLPPQFFERLDKFIQAAQSLIGTGDGSYMINQMTSEELKNLADIVSSLKTLITNVNKFHANAMFQHVHEAGDSTITALGSMESDSGKHSGMKNFLFWEQIRPAYGFERFGEGGKAIYDGLRRGQAQLAFDAHKILNFADKAYSEQEVQKWSKETHTIQLADGSSIQLTVAAMMSFYELSKRKQALQHMLGGGIRAAAFHQKGKAISDEGHMITLEDVDDIVSALTPRQMEVADNIQQFMEKQGGAWGNHVSMARFGERLFGEEHYFPINSDGRHLQATADEKAGAGLYSLLNMGFTKQLTEGAHNRIILYNIFDVFANHMSSMAQYHAMALPVLDAVKWFNYQQKMEIEEETEGGTVTRTEVKNTVRDELARVFGSFEDTRVGSGKKSFAESFVLNILRGYNGTEAQGSPVDSVGLKMLHRYNRAQVAYNLRVVIQQPLAITRAGLLIDYSSIVRGMRLSPGAIQKNIQEMQRYSGIAAWKDLGFYDVNISRGLTSMIKHEDSVSDKITEKGMWLAEKADQMTWAAIWSACKEEVLLKQEISYGTPKFFEAVTALFEDVVYKTQVVDSILTKNEFMRDKGYFARAAGSFMSEPTTTASMLMNVYDQYQMDRQRGLSMRYAWEKNRKLFVRTAYVYGVGAVMLAAVQAISDGFRDDDDYEEYSEKWAEAFLDNFLDELIPFNKLPLINDFWEMGQEMLAILAGVDTYGNAPTSVIGQLYDYLIKGSEIIHDKIAGEDTNYTWYAGAYKLLQAVSGIFGLPMAAATREIVTMWNNTVGAMAPSLKVKTYDPGEENTIKYAYKDGYLTAEEAYEELITKGLTDNENEAYWKVQEWGSTSDSYSRYDAVLQAVRSGAEISEEMAELTSHGYTEKDVRSHIKSCVGKWYQDGEITKQQATDMLRTYSGLSTDEITKAVNKWSSKVVTGIAFEDIRDQFMTGKITQSRAVDMYVRYGGYTKEDAQETVGVWAFVKKHPDCEGISWTAIEKYHEYSESTGMKPKAFYEAWKFNSNTHADVDENGEPIDGSKKRKVLEYVNGLSLTNKQKDSLYYAFGWAASRIHEAPWR